MDKRYAQLAGHRVDIAAGEHLVFDVLEFILANVPYGRIASDDLQRGLMQIDGPASDPEHTVPHLYWYFDGTPHAIAKAVRIPYVYSRAAPTGYSQSYSDSILIGYELHNSKSLPMTQTLSPSTSQATMKNEPKVVSLGSGAESITNFLQAVPAEEYAQADLTTNAVTSSDETDSDFIEYDGLARDYHAANPFPYTFEMVAADQEMYGQLLYWFFGGKFYRLTKAMRLSHAAFNVEGKPRVTLFVGYQGPSM